MKSNRENIVKALECCIVQHTECRKCPLLYTACESGACYKQAKIDALALIKELTEENENLNERLNREARCQYDLCGQIVNLHDDVKYVKADTVQKMQELTKVNLDKYGNELDGYSIVDQTAEEMLEENNV